MTGSELKYIVCYHSNELFESRVFGRRGESPRGLVCSPVWRVNDSMDRQAARSPVQAASTRFRALGWARHPSASTKRWHWQRLWPESRDEIKSQWYQAAQDWIELSTVLRVISRLEAGRRLRLSSCPVKPLIATSLESAKRYTRTSYEATSADK